MSNPVPPPHEGGSGIVAPGPLKVWATWSAVALVLGLIAASMPFPARFATVALALVTVLLVSIALWHTSGVKGAASIRGLLIISVVIAGVLLIFGMSWLLVAPEIMDHEACRDAAITPTAKTQCDADFEKAVNGKFGLPTSGE